PDRTAPGIVPGKHRAPTRTFGYRRRADRHSHAQGALVRAQAVVFVDSGPRTETLRMKPGEWGALRQCTKACATCTTAELVGNQTLTLTARDCSHLNELPSLCGNWPFRAAC